LSGIWLFGYLALFVLLAIMFIFMLGMLRQIGELQRRLMPATARTHADIPAPEDDGPPIGSRLRDFVSETANGFGSLTLDFFQTRALTLLVFLSPTCESCQDIAEALNELSLDPPRGVRPVVIMRADERSSRAFLSVFPLAVPMVCDGGRVITHSFDIHRHPFALMYDSDALLAGKGTVFGLADLQQLVNAVPERHIPYGGKPIVTESHLVQA